MNALTIQAQREAALIEVVRLEKVLRLACWELAPLAPADVLKLSVPVSELARQVILVDAALNRRGNAWLWPGICATWWARQQDVEAFASRIRSEEL
jgi:hypothetical protein